MAISFQQTDTAAPCGALQACSGIAPAADADAREATKSGTAGTTELACDVAAGGSEACYMDELAVADGDSLDAGTLTARINITSAQMNLTWEEIHVCRLNSSCTSQETLGSATGLGTDVSGGGVFSQNVTLSAASAHNAGDVVYLVYVFANSHSMASRSVAITPDQLVDTPFSEAAAEVTEQLSDPVTFADAETDTVVATESLSDPADFSDSVTETEAGAQVTESLSDPTTFGDSLSGVSVASESLSDPVGVSDGAVGLKIEFTGATDDATFADSVTDTEAGAAVTESLSDDASFTDNLSETAEASESLSDSATFADSVDATLTALEAFTDPVIFVDAASDGAAAAENLSDATTFGDAVTETTEGEAVESLSDDVQLGDNLSETVETLATLSDQVDAGDALSETAEVSESATDATTFSDNVTASEGGQVVTESLSDVATFGDSTTPSAEVSESAADTVLFADSAADQMAAVEQISADSQLADALGARRTTTAALTDDATFADSLFAPGAALGLSGPFRMFGEGPERTMDGEGPERGMTGEGPERTMDGEA